MTDNHDERAFITAVLRADEAHLDDAGFTDRVLASLPRPRRRRRFTLRDAVIAAASVAAATAGAFASAHAGATVFVSVLPLAAIAALGIWGALASADA
jgi:hypothetical protein